MATYISAPRLNRFLVLCGAVALAATTAAVGCAKDDTVASENAPEPTGTAESNATGGSCTVPLSDFAKKTVATLEAHFCDEAKDGDKHENKPTVDPIQKEKDAIFMNLAFALVDKKWDTKRGHPIGAVIVKDDKVVRWDLNSNFAEWSPIEHAEVRSLRGFFDDFKTAGGGGSPSDQLQKATVYGTLEPCQMCAGTINMARVKRVVFGLKDNRFGDAINYLHSSPYHSDFEQNVETRAVKELTTAINKDINASLAPLMEENRASFHRGAEDLASFRVQHRENETALRNAKAALADM